MAVCDDYDDANPRVVLTVEPIGRAGEGLAAHLSPDHARRLVRAISDALREIGLDRLIAVGLAKQEELLFTRERDAGIALPHDTPALQLLQRIRDEAHRFAITFHRQSRAKHDLRSALDDIAGIGPRRRTQLLTTFGSVAGVRRASREDLAAVVGAKAAHAVRRHFGG